MPAASHLRITWALGLSLFAHGLALGVSGRFGPVSPAMLAAFEPIEVTLTGTPSLRNLSPRPSQTARPPATETAPGTGPASDSTDDTPIVEARSDVATLNNPKPPYPLAARRRLQEGRVLLAVRVAADGTCAEVRLRQSSGHALLDDSALSTVRRWRFVPARRGDTPVETWVDVPISFRLNS
jgi:protein TonB